MLSILREDILPLTRRKVEGNRPVFKTFQRCQGQNRPRPSGLKENTRLKSKNARKGTKPCLALFQHHSTGFLKKNCIRLVGPDPCCPVAFHVRFFHKPPGKLFPITTCHSPTFHRTHAVTATDENRRKRIVWRACHRGIKEMDIVVGGFVKSRIRHSDEAELQELERILQIPDLDLLAWLTGTQPVPEEQQSPLLLEMLATRFDESLYGKSQ